MALMEVNNDSAQWLIVWLEPLGEDRWLKRGEALQIRTDYVGDELAFGVLTHASEKDRADGIDNLSVYVERGHPMAVVTDRDGNVLECGHQRPDEVDQRWKAQLAAMEEVNRTS